MFESDSVLEVRVRRLERTLLRDRRIASAVSLALVALLALAWQERAKPAEFDELRAKRIDIVDEQGQRQIVLSCRERFPLPRLKGKDWPRSIAPAGMVFYRSDGDECGGLALAEGGGVQKTMLIFDYSNSEGIGMAQYETKDGHYGAQLSILDRLPLDSDVMKAGTVGRDRVVLANDNGSALLVLADAQGRPRLRLSVAAGGTGGLELLDEKGEVVEHWP